MFKSQLYYMEATPSSGSVSWNTGSMYGECINIYVKPTTNTTIYHFKIVGPNGFILYNSPSTTATERGELTFVGSPIIGLVNGIYTCTISLSSVDELFKVQMNIKQYAVVR